MTKKWFQIGLVSIFLLSLALRFWGLERFNTLVFDEIYYAKFGNDYLTGVPFFDGHPPFGKLVIALGIWLGKHVPWSYEVNGLTGALMSPVAYRWMNAFTGSFIPLLVAGIAYQLSHRRSFGLIAGLFTALDGIFIVEARYALINQYIVICGLLGQFLLLLALNKKNQRRHVYLAVAGIAFGASIATKWNGLWYLLGAYSLWILAWGFEIIRSLASKNETDEDYEHKLSNKAFGSQIATKYWAKADQVSSYARISPLQNLTQLNIFHVAIYLGIIPVIIYSIIWIPHLLLDTRYNFIEVHKQILGFHERMGGNNASVHPYCAAWYKWPLMTRPMAYYYQTAQSFQDPLPVFGPPLPQGAGKVIYDVHAMGNPFLWWSGFAAIIFLCGMLVWVFVRKVVAPWVEQERLVIPLTIDTWIALYLVVNYLVNLMPWVKVIRCLFIYHYMTGVVFAFMAIAWVVDQCIRSYRVSLRAAGVTITFLIIGAFIFWLPIYLGLPITSEAYKLRMWFTSWI
ncbi:glycosyl transferase family protein [Calothrix sp. NIES-4071]|nr:glycosyl transferase family protein [Calothrix sp. NIES-4071]BAZ61422.1 glycosyl transferase family protein [Calothrix sp. NIES-4105]